VTSATIDSSVYIRALHLGGPAALLIGHAKAGNIRIDLSDAILTETRACCATSSGGRGTCFTMRAASWVSSPTV
jgi:hypothetical protein